MDNKYFMMNMASDNIFDITPGAFDDIPMVSHAKDPDIVLLCEELEFIVDDFMSMYRIDYSGNMVDVSHDSSSGIESGEVHIPRSKSDAIQKPGLTNSRLSADEKAKNLTENILKQNGVVFSNPHRRDPSWSTCSDMDSDIRSETIFSSSDTDNNARYTNVQSLQNHKLKSNGVHRRTPNFGESNQRIVTQSRTFKSAPLKSKKHVTFQAANGIDPLIPLSNDSQSVQYHDSDILYYEDDGVVADVQYYNSKQNMTSQSDQRQSPVSDKLRVPNRRGNRSAAARLIQSYHRKQSSLGDDNSGYQGSEDEDVSTDTSGEITIRRTPIKDIIHRHTPSPRTLTPVPNGQNESHSDVEPRRKSKASYFDKLPDDVLIKIFSHLPTDKLCRSARVCRRWYFLAYTPSLWTTISIDGEFTNVDRALKVLTRRLSYDTPTVCVMVERIQLTGCKMLTDKGLYTIAKRCPELRQLEMTGCPNVSNIALFELVSRCVNLEHLNTAGCENITCISLTPQATVQAQTYGKQIDLRYLDMSDCVNLEDSGLQIIASYCSQLVYLYLRRCVKVTDIGVQYVANYCSNLKEFSICDCKNVTDFGLKELSKLGSNLRYLSAAKCCRITDNGVMQIAKHCHRLRYLNVRGCEGVSDDSIEVLARNCPRLRSLDIGKCDITDDSLFVLAEHCTQLRKLSLKSCDAITDSGITNIAERCRSLQQLNIQECHLTVNAYRTVKALCKRCIIEHTNPGFY